MTTLKSNTPPYEVGFCVLIKTHMLRLKNIRQTEWMPFFKEYISAETTADIINLEHEDYPERVEITTKLIEQYKNKDIFTDQDILDIHKKVGFGKDFAGKWRDCFVRVGYHIPPHYNKISKYLTKILPISRQDLNNRYKAKDWYVDFETLHPFQDYNGRVGGIVLACLTYNPSDESFLSRDYELECLHRVFGRFI